MVADADTVSDHDRATINAPAKPIQASIEEAERFRRELMQEAAAQPVLPPVTQPNKGWSSGMIWAVAGGVLVVVVLLGGLALMMMSAGH